MCVRVCAQMCAQPAVVEEGVQCVYAERRYAWQSDQNSLLFEEFLCISSVVWLEGLWSCVWPQSSSACKHYKTLAKHDTHLRSAKPLRLCSSSERVKKRLLCQTWLVVKVPDCVVWQLKLTLCRYGASDRWCKLCVLESGQCWDDEPDLHQKLDDGISKYFQPVLCPCSWQCWNQLVFGNLTDLQKSFQKFRGRSVTWTLDLLSRAQVVVNWLKSVYASQISLLFPGKIVCIHGNLLWMLEHVEKFVFCLFCLFFSLFLRLQRRTRNFEISSLLSFCASFDWRCVGEIHGPRTAGISGREYWYSLKPCLSSSLAHTMCSREGGGGAK